MFIQEFFSNIFTFYNIFYGSLLRSHYSIFSQWYFKILFCLVNNKKMAHHRQKLTKRLTHTVLSTTNVSQVGTSPRPTSAFLIPAGVSITIPPVVGSSSAGSGTAAAGTAAAGSAAASGTAAAAAAVAASATARAAASASAASTRIHWLLLSGTRLSSQSVV
jgi:hypothetical protein